MDMMVTDRLARQLHVGEICGIPKNGDSKFMDRWYADTYAIKNRKFYIFTEANTMFSVFAYGKGVTSGAAFAPFFYDNVRRAMLDLLPMMRMTCLENPSILYCPSVRNVVSETQAAHIAMAKSYAECHVKSSECNMRPVSDLDCRIPILLFMAEIVKLCSKAEPHVDISQIN